MEAIELSPTAPRLEHSPSGASNILSRVHALLGHCCGSFDRLDSFVQLLEQLVFDFDAQGFGLSPGLSAAQIAELNDAYRQWETELEERFLSRIDGCASGVDDYRLSERFRRLLGRELELVSTAGPERRLPGRRALFVGSGPFPISAIWAHRLSGLRLDCVDSNLDAVRQSRDVLQRLGLSDAIRVHHDDGQTVEAERYGCVLIALLAKPKEAILQNLARRMPPGARVVCRTSHGLRRLLYEPTELSEATRRLFRVPDERQAVKSSDDTISSLLLVRRDEEAS